jgi:hypothetical protein
MKKLVFAIALFLIVPALRAQQTETSGNPPQAAPQASPEAAPQPAAQNPNPQDNLPAAVRPGHPLDPADVDVPCPSWRAPTEDTELTEITTG